MTHLSYAIVSGIVTSGMQVLSPLPDYTLVGREQANYIFECFIISVKVYYFNK